MLTIRCKNKKNRFTRGSVWTPSADCDRILLAISKKHLPEPFKIRAKCVRCGTFWVIDIKEKSIEMYPVLKSEVTGDKKRFTFIEPELIGYEMEI